MRIHLGLWSFSRMASARHFASLARHSGFLAYRAGSARRLAPRRPYVSISYIGDEARPSYHNAFIRHLDHAARHLDHSAVCLAGRAARTHGAPDEAKGSPAEISGAARKLSGLVDPLQREALVGDLTEDVLERRLAGYSNWRIRQYEWKVIVAAAVRTRASAALHWLRRTLLFRSR
ncbi:MAG: hypothetical protein HOP29_14945 [Phycisphaerales bacterium]|nr:hypothetical protein [Phycisphaerales bacterium]